MDAIKEGVRATLVATGLTPLCLFEVVPEVEGLIERTPDTLNCDVVIVRVGGAGLMVAIQANQDGADVIVLEMMPMVGGNSLKAIGGMNAAGTRFRKALGITDSGVQEFIEDTMNGGHQLNDIALVTAMAKQSSDAVNWLADLGVELPKVAATGFYAYIIFDQRVVNDLHSTQKYINSGLTVQADTYEELSKLIGLKGSAVQNFVSTMETWGNTAQFTTKIKRPGKGNQLLEKRY